MRIRYQDCDRYGQRVEIHTGSKKFKDHLRDRILGELRRTSDDLVSQCWYERRSNATVIVARVPNPNFDRNPTMAVRIVENALKPLGLNFNCEY